jgi:hypothetical protein
VVHSINQIKLNKTKGSIEPNQMKDQTKPKSRRCLRTCTVVDTWIDVVELLWCASALPSIVGCLRFTITVGCVLLYQALWDALYHYCGMLQALPSIVGCALPLLWDALCFTKHCGMLLLYQLLWDASASPTLGFLEYNLTLCVWSKVKTAGSVL